MVRRSSGTFPAGSSGAIGGEGVTGTVSNGACGACELVMVTGALLRLKCNTVRVECADLADTVGILCSVTEGASDGEADIEVERKLVSVLDALAVSDGAWPFVVCVCDGLAEGMEDREVENDWDKVAMKDPESDTVARSEKDALPLAKVVRLRVALSVRQLRPPYRGGHVQRQSG